VSISTVKLLTGIHEIEPLLTRHSLSQLLEVLLDLNTSLKIPASLRYDLSTILQNPLSLEEANAKVSELRALVQVGDYPQQLYTMNLRYYEGQLSHNGARKLSEMEGAIPHPVPADQDKSEIDHIQRPEYQTTKMHEASLLAMDAKLSDQYALSQAPAPAPTSTKFGDMSAREVEREVELRNHHSVHNWLKRHSEKDPSAGAAAADDAASEVGVATPATGKKRGGNLAKRVGDKAVDRARGGDKNREDGSPASTRTAGTTGDTELGDEDAVGEESVVPASGRKKGGDKDDTYRPKGGRSSKAKRKRADDGEGTPTGSKGKKAKTGGSAAAAAAAATAAAAAAGASAGTADV